MTNAEKLAIKAGIFAIVNAKEQYLMADFLSGTESIRFEEAVRIMLSMIGEGKEDE